MSVITSSSPQKISSSALANKPKLKRTRSNLWDLAEAAEKQSKPKESYEALYLKSRQDWKLWEEKQKSDLEKINANSPSF